jgi:hypothetical protein
MGERDQLGVTDEPDERGGEEELQRREVVQLGEHDAPDAIERCRPADGPRLARRPVHSQTARSRPRRSTAPSRASSST